MKLLPSTIKALNRRLYDIANGYKVIIGEYVYWVNTVTREVYRQRTLDWELYGLYGERCARVTDDWIMIVALKGEDNND